MITTTVSATRLSIVARRRRRTVNPGIGDSSTGRTPLSQKYHYLTAQQTILHITALTACRQ